MTYSEGNTYKTVALWDIFTRESMSDPWTKLRTSTKDETEFVESENRRAGWQTYAIIRQTRSI